jgi:hypothetical protein
MSVAVSLDTAFDPGQLPVGQQLSPPAQVEAPLFLVDRQFECQHCHDTTLFDPAGSVNLRFGRGMVRIRLLDFSALDILVRFGVD